MVAKAGGQGHRRSRSSLTEARLLVDWGHHVFANGAVLFVGLDVADLAAIGALALSRAAGILALRIRGARGRALFVG